MVRPLHSGANMTTHPVRLSVVPPASMQRIHVIIRLVLLLALGTLGGSSLYWLLYLGLPALVALRIASSGSARYFADDVPRITRALRWAAGAYAYLWLLTDAVPSSEAGSAVDLGIAPEGSPTAGSALLRLLYSVPALLLLAVLSIAAGILWIIGALAVLLARRVPRGITSFLSLTLCYQFRLFAYHLSLVERYPSLEAESRGAEGEPDEPTDRRRRQPDGGHLQATSDPTADRARTLVGADRE
jgi:hypothetical protein